MNFDNRRITKIDNIKIIMIFLVVGGHVINEFVDKSNCAKFIFLYIYYFHMPIFVFVSGMLSKKIVRNRQYYKILSYGCIYVVLKFCLALFLYCIHDTSEIKLDLFYDTNVSWYAFAMMIFMLLTILLKDANSTYLIIASIIFSCIAGYSDNMGSLFVSMRIATFYPFFLMGFFSDTERVISFLENRTIKICSLFMIGITSYICWMQVERLFPFVIWLKGVYNYNDMERIIGITKTTIPFFFMRLCYYMISIILSISVMSVIPEKKMLFSSRGANTLSVYMWHIFIVAALFHWKNGAEFIMRKFPKTYVLVVIVISVFVTWILSFSFLKKLTEKIITIPYKKTD